MLLTVTFLATFSFDVRSGASVPCLTCFFRSFPFFSFGAGLGAQCSGAIREVFGEADSTWQGGAATHGGGEEGTPPAVFLDNEQQYICTGSTFFIHRAS